MRSIVKWLYLIALVSVVCGIISILGIMIESHLILNVIIVVCGLLSIIIVYSLSVAISKQNCKFNELKETIVQLNKQLKSSEDFRGRFRDALKTESDRADVLEQENQKLKVEIAQVKGAFISDADLVLMNFRNNVTTRFFEQLRGVNMPLDLEERQVIIDNTINVAMMALDIAETLQWSDVVNREEQKLNVGIINGTISHEDALNNAIKITDNPTITPKWARALGMAFKGVVSEDANIIFSGYKM